MRGLIIFVACLLVLVGGCAAPRPAPQPSPQPAPEQPKGTAVDYFPYKPGMKLAYQGKGNEYASYTVTVLYSENGKLEWRRNTGGTVMAEVFRLEPDQVTLTYREGEAYDNEKRFGKSANTSQVVLKGPIAPGTTWTSGDATYKILSTAEKVEAVGKTLTDVVLVEAKRSKSTVRSYYSKAYGMVLSVFESEGAVVESRLKSITGP